METVLKQAPTPPSDAAERTDSPPQSATYARAACTECSRRKQKCNREWPCNHCKKRKVGNQCRYHHDSPSGSRAPAGGPAQEAKRKRDRSEEDEDDDEVDAGDVSADYGGEGFEALGYSTAHLFAGLTTRDESTTRKPTPKQYFKDVENCPQLARALQKLPPRPHCDLLVQNFLNNVNYHYYIIYAPNFLEEYQAWWKDRVARKPLSVQWTCLLITICACSCQYTDVELQRRLEGDLSESIQTLTELYHNTARELRTVIPVGHNHLLTVQQLLHSCYWYKGEVRFVECWHVLGSAIREAQEMGMHQESLVGPIPEFEREMRRRVWCVLDTWDWQISALLGRPMIIDRSDCDIGSPSLSLEDLDPSPLLHMKLQSQLIGKMSRKFGLPKYIVTADDVQKYQSMIETWMKGFPKWYDIEDPDTSRDDKNPWMKLHRYYLHTMGHSMILDPIRAFLARDMSKASTPEDLGIRRDGINYCLRLMDALYGFFEVVYPRDSKFHFVIFCLFDTAAVLCSTIIHDQDDSAPRKGDMLEAIDGAIDMLKKLAEVTEGAKTSHRILSRIALRTRVAAERSGHSAGSSKRTRITAASKMESMRKNTIKQEPPPEDEAAPAPVATSGPVSTSTSATVVNGHGQPDMSSMVYSMPPQPAQVAHSGFHEPQAAHVADHSIAPHFPTENMMPQVTFASHVPPPYAMDPLIDLETTTATNGHGTMPHVFHNGTNVLVDPQPPEAIPLDFSNITEEELGQLAALWQYRSLNLDFINPRPQ